MADVSHFFSKIAGVSHANRDGTRRQAALRHCHPWEHLRLETEPDNRFDPNAMALIAESGRQLGYLSSGLAAEVHQRSDKGYSFTVFIAEITGGGEDQYLGCNILVIQAGPGATEADVLAYLDEARETDDELAEMPRLRLMGQRPMPDRRELRPGWSDRLRQASLYLRDGLWTLWTWLRPLGACYGRALDRLLGPDRDLAYWAAWWVLTIPAVAASLVFIGYLILSLAKFLHP